MVGGGGEGGVGEGEGGSSSSSSSSSGRSRPPPLPTTPVACVALVGWGADNVQAASNSCQRMSLGTSVGQLVPIAPRTQVL